MSYPSNRRSADGVLLLYHQNFLRGALSESDSINAFREYSRFPIWPLNTYYGFPDRLRRNQSRIIVLHYTMFYDAFRPLSPEFLEYLDTSRSSHLVVMFQDEQTLLEERRTFCRDYEVDTIYTAFEPAAAESIYRGAAPGAQLFSHLPGYVSERLKQSASRTRVSDELRQIDVGYRGRRVPPEWGPSGQEKYEIGVGFQERARDLGLCLDIGTGEADRLYGKAWYRFIANCRATLGTESGVELIWDPERCRLHYVGAAEAHGVAVSYRTIGPRHLEAAALRSCQILFEGRYSGLLEPMVHYIPLRKDFANFDDVLSSYRDQRVRARLADNAYRDLVEAPRAGYPQFIERFDEALGAAGIQAVDRRSTHLLMSAVTRSPRLRRRARIWLRRVRHLGLRLRT